MRAEKQFLTDEYVERLNESPFFIATEYKGITVAEFEDLRGKLRGVNAEIHVVKNSVFVAAAAEARDSGHQWGRRSPGRKAPPSGSSRPASHAATSRSVSIPSRDGDFRLWLFIYCFFPYNKASAASP